MQVIRNTSVLVILAGLVLVAAWYVLSLQSQGSVTPTTAPAALPEVGQVDDPAAGERLVFDVTVHTLEEMRELLSRAEHVSRKHPVDPADSGETAGIALVLHGPEIEFFANKNYEQYKEVVDLAARLDAYQVIDVKICRETMQDLGLESRDLPPFVEEVPYGPDEVERLRREGYTVL